jgi:hypothetical protein
MIEVPIVTFSEEQIFGFFKDDSSVLNLSSFSVQELGEVHQRRELVKD